VLILSSSYFFYFLKKTGFLSPVLITSHISLSALLVIHAVCPVRKSFRTDIFMLYFREAFFCFIYPKNIWFRFFIFDGEKVNTPSFIPLFFAS
jgi:hypothetical protein